VQIPLLSLAGQDVSWDQTRPKKKLAFQRIAVAQERHTPGFFQQKILTGLITELPTPTAFGEASDIVIFKGRLQRGGK